MNFPWIILGLLTLVRLLFAALGHFSETESYLLLCSHHLDWGFVEGPAGIPALMRLSELFLGQTPLAIRWLSPFLLLGSSWILWRWVTDLSNRTIAFWVVIIFNLLPLANAAGVVMEGTMVEALCWLAALSVAWKLIVNKTQKNKISSWAIFGVILAIGTQVTYQMGWLLPLVVVASLKCFQNKISNEHEITVVSSSWKKAFGILAAILILAVSWLPIFWWNQNHDWLQFQNMTWDSFWAWPPLGDGSLQHLPLIWSVLVLAPLFVAGACCFSGIWNSAQIFYADSAAACESLMKAALASNCSSGSMKDTAVVAIHRPPCLHHAALRLATNRHEIFELENPFFLVISIPFFFCINELGHEKIPFALVLVMTALFLPIAVEFLIQTRRRAIVGLLFLLALGCSSLLLLFEKIPSSTIQESAWSFSSAAGVVGTEAAADQLMKLRATYSDTSGRAPFLIAETPGLAAILGALLPIDYPERPGAPSVFISESPALGSQFQFWPHYADATTENTTPDPLYTEEKAVSPFLGHDAFYITAEKLEEIPQTITGAFTAVIPLSVTFTLTKNGRPDQLNVYLCQSYQMLSL